MLFFLGLLLIVRGGDRFVDAAAGIAETSGVPPFVIGATIVSVATTLPEILVSVMAASSGQPEMAAGNAIGSVTANTAMILALSALLMPSEFERSRLMPKALLFIGAIVLLWLTCLKGSLTPFGSIALVLLFVVFIVENLHSAKRELQTGERNRGEKGSVKGEALWLLLGAGAILAGSRLLVDNGTAIARDVLHVDERVISLTMVAIGTSLPELVTAVSAVVKRKGSLAVGNIIGANIIDMLLILPLCSLANGGSLPIGSSTIWLDLPVSLAAAVIMLVPALIRGRFSRVQGAAALALYMAYLMILFV